MAAATIQAETPHVRVSFAGAAERAFGGRFGRQLVPLGDRLDSILYGIDDRSVSQRIAVIAFAVRVVSAGIAYISQVLLARWMGDFEYGVFVVVWVGAVILGGIACLGFQTAIVRFVPEYVERGDSDLLRGVLVGSRLYGFLAASAIAGLGMLGLMVFGDLLSNYYLIPLYLGAVTLPMLALGEVQDGVSRAFSWADLSLWPTYIVRPIIILGAMAAAIALGWKPDAVTAMGAVIVATYLTSIAQLVTLERRLRRTVPSGPRRYQPMLWIGVALPIFVVEGFFNLLTNVDILLVGYFLQPDLVAVYFAATKTLALVHFVYFAVRAGGAQRFSKYYTNGDDIRLRSFVRDTLHWTFWPSLLLVAFVLLVGKQLLLLFGPTFGSGYPLLVILSAGILARASIGPAESLLTMAGQQRLCAAIYTIAFIVNVALNLALIPVLGLSGAAIATATALLLESVALYLAARNRLGIHSFVFFAFGPVAAEGEKGR
ncbi:MAG: lipopolysaccharide biosynthesis protein [Bauldia sp.]|nr:lipopolysaccharide biosynthesis protein [Bauldia sp.]